MRACLLLATATLTLLTSLAFGLTEEEGTLGAQAVTNSCNIERTYQINGDALEFWVYVPIPQNPAYSSIWTQSLLSGSLTTWPENPPAALYEFPEGVWVEFGPRSNETVKVTVSADVMVTSTLSGITRDLPTGSGSWYQETTRCQNVPGLSSTMNNIVQGYVAGTALGNWGIVERWVAWLNQNIIKVTDHSSTFETSDAMSVYQSRSGPCIGYANLFKAGISAALSPALGCGIVLGSTLAGTEMFPGDHYSVTTRTLDGPHGWTVVDDGSQWIPVDPYHGTIGLATVTRWTDGIYEDQSDACDVISYSYDGLPPNITHATRVWGSTGSASYVSKRERNPFDGQVYVMHWLKEASLRPISDGFPITGVPDNPIIDRFKANTFRVYPNPAARWVETQLYLERDAHVLAQVFSVDGRFVDTVLDERRSQGYNYILWQPRDAASGQYYLRATFNGGEQVETTKFMLVR